MGLSRLAKACRDCPFVETCQNKRMEALAYLPMAAEASTQAGMSAAAPVLRETMTINAGDGTMVQVYWELEHAKEAAGFEFAPRKPYDGPYQNTVYRHWETIVNGKIPFGYSVKEED